MMFTTEMIQLFAVALGKDSQRLTEVLLREGVLQFINTTELEGHSQELSASFEPKENTAEITSLRQRIEGFLLTNGILPDAPKESDLTNRVDVKIREEKNYLDQLEAERNGIRDRQRVIQQEILKLEDIRRQVDIYGIGLSETTLRARHSFLAIQTGKIPAKNIAKIENDLRDYPSMAILLGKQEEMAHYLLISMKRDSEQIGKILSGLGWTEIELPNELQSVKEDVSKEFITKTKSLTQEQKQLEMQAKELVAKHSGQLNKLWCNLRVNELLDNIQSNFKVSSRTVVFSGWLPSSRKEKLTEKIQKACSGRCYLEWHPVSIKEISEDEVPVQFHNPKVFAPFQMLVSNFGIPPYGTIDPTAVVMPIYLTMFGMMFADVGQGLVLLIIGILVALKTLKNPRKKPIYTLSWLIIWCGLSSMLFGALFGSYFGHKLLEPLWFYYHGVVAGRAEGVSSIRKLEDILAITVYFGISVIILGLVFNWINLIRTGKWMELVFDKGGILGGWIYAGGIYIAKYMIAHSYKELPSGGVLFILAGLPALLLFIKEPYHHKKHHTGHGIKPADIMTFVMQWIVELLEIFSGYLSNTLSFMRVAGLGIAHVSLMIAFFAISEMTSGIFSILILILGNILVIGLEGLSAGIQSLRLNYYEFFTKFFHGTGKLYTPISLNSSYR
jgi:V/A-type H+/Na+-transporting ATPase subunit I